MAEQNDSLVLSEGNGALVERSILLAINGESHTLGNALRDVMWSHPHIQLASYTQEHPTSTEVLLRCQTDGTISAEQGVVEALHISKLMLRHVGECMDAAYEAWQQQQASQPKQEPGAQPKQPQQRQQKQKQLSAVDAAAAEPMDEDVDIE